MSRNDRRSDRQLHDSEQPDTDARESGRVARRATDEHHLGSMSAPNANPEPEPEPEIKPGTRQEAKSTALLTSNEMAQSASLPATFKDRLRAARPDVVARQEKNASKRAIAIQLRALRDARGMTQADVARASGMAQPSVARMEALTGPVPSIPSIERYVAGCGGYMVIVISTEAFDLPGVFSPAAPSASRLSSAYLPNCPPI